MADVQWVNGLRAFRNENAPDWALTKLTCYKSEFIDWLNEQPDDVVYLEVLRAKASGKPYLKVDEDQKAYMEKVRTEELTKAKEIVKEEILEDDIPF